MKTLAAILRESNKPLSIEEIEIPDLRMGEVLVKVLYSGLCHSQINEVRALNGPDRYLPHTLGHEASAIVQRTHETVTKVGGGDYVVVSWIKGSGLDTKDLQYNKDGEKINSGSAATFLNYAVVSENRLTKIPRIISGPVVSLLGCAIPTGGGIVKNDINPALGDSIAIFGIGGIGSSALLYAAAISINPLIAVDINKSKLDFAREIGATHTINAAEGDVYKKISDLTNGVGVNYSIETAGSKKAMEEAFSVIKEGKDGRDGGLTIIAGNIGRNEKIKIYPFDLIKGKRIRGSWGGSTNPDRDIPFYAKMYIDGKLKLEKLITRTYSLTRINQAIHDLEEGKIIRAVINCQD